MEFRKIFFVLLLALSIFGLSCPSKIILEDKNPTPEPVGEATPEEKIDDFEACLKQVQTGSFDYVYAFRRKDGDVFISEDKRYLKENSPRETNQWVLTADEKAVIAGSNYAFTPENLDALKKRFKIEDYSPKKVAPKKESNSNINR